MDRLTFEGNFCDIAQCREIPCPYNGACSQRKVWERLAAYEDTGLTPGDIEELLDVAVSKTNNVLRIKEELRAMKNELCQYCGKYKQAHDGACDGCRWREK